MNWAREIYSLIKQKIIAIESITLKLLFLSLLLCISPGLLAEDICEDALSCKAALIKIGEKCGEKCYGIDQEGQSLSKRINSLTIDMMPMLLELTEYDQKGVRNLASFTISNLDKIDHKYLSDIASRLEDKSWLIRALTKFRTPESAKIAVSHFYKQVQQRSDYGDYVVRELGELSIPHILDVLKCSTPCPDNYAGYFGSLLSEIKVDKTNLVRQIIVLIESPDLSNQATVGLIEVLAALETDALPATPFLRKLKKESPKLEEVINYAFMTIGTQEGVELLIEHVERLENEEPFYELAKHGYLAKSSVNSVVNALKVGDTRFKRLAARTLGYIGSRIAINELTIAANAPNDVVLNIIAIQSLAMIHAESSLVELNETARNHWYPPVAIAAKEAVINIEKNIKGPKAFSRQEYWSFFHFDSIHKLQYCENHKLKQKTESANRKIYSSNAPDTLHSLSFNTQILSYGANDVAEQETQGKEIIEVHSGNIVEHRSEIKQTPDLGLRIQNGWLVGSDRGEWGGELVYLPDSGEPQVILRENVEDIYYLGERIVAVTGLAHLGSNSGVVFSLNFREDGSWEAEPWVQLPGAPQSSWFVETGELLINLYSGGSILISKDGEFRMAPCTDEKQ